MNSGAEMSEWLQQPTNPDPQQDLGYELDSWEEAETWCRGEEHVVFFPSADRVLDDAEFVVAHPDDVCDLCDKR